MHPIIQKTTAMLLRLVLLLPLALFFGWLASSLVVGLLEPRLIIVATPICAWLLMRRMNQSLRELMPLS